MQTIAALATTTAATIYVMANTHTETKEHIESITANAYLFDCLCERIKSYAFAAAHDNAQQQQWSNSNNNNINYYNDNKANKGTWTSDKKPNGILIECKWNEQLAAQGGRASVQQINTSSRRLHATQLQYKVNVERDKRKCCNNNKMSNNENATKRNKNNDDDSNKNNKVTTSVDGKRIWAARSNSRGRQGNKSTKKYSK